MTELNTTDGKNGFIVACVFTGILLVLTLFFGFSEGWGATQTLFSLCATFGLGAWAAWKYVEWKRENL